MKGGSRRTASRVVLVEATNNATCSTSIAWFTSTQLALTQELVLVPAVKLLSPSSVLRNSCVIKTPGTDAEAKLLINRLFTGTLWHKRSKGGLYDDEMGDIQPKWQITNATRQCYRKLWMRQWERGEAAVGDFVRTELARLGRDGVLPIGGERKRQSYSWMRWRLLYACGWRSEEVDCGSGSGMMP